jgi:hypothetical protein
VNVRLSRHITLRSKTLTLLFPVVLGCAKGQEIDLQDVVILPINPPSVADASAGNAGDAGAALDEALSPAPELAATPPVGEPSTVSPEVEPRDAAAPPLGDSGT